MSSRDPGQIQQPGEIVVDTGSSNCHAVSVVEYPTILPHGQCRRGRSKRVGWLCLALSHGGAIQMEYNRYNENQFNQFKTLQLSTLFGLAFVGWLVS